MSEQTDFKFPFNPDEEIQRLLAQDHDNRDYDTKSRHRIWTVAARTVSIHAFNYPDFIKNIREQMDGIRAEYPYMKLKDKDFSLSSEVEWCYEDSYGAIKIEAEVVEREDSWRTRLCNLDNYERREVEKLKIMSEKLGYKIEKITA